MTKISNRRLAIVVAAYLVWPIPAFLIMPRLFGVGGLCDSVRCRTTAVFLFQVVFLALIGIWLRNSARHVPVWDTSEEPPIDRLPEQQRKFQEALVRRLSPGVFNRIVQNTSNGVTLHGLAGSHNPASFFFVLRYFSGGGDSAAYFMRDLHRALTRSLLPPGNFGDRIVYLVVCGPQIDLDHHADQFHAEFIKRVMTFRCVHLVDVQTGRTEIKMSRWGRLEFGRSGQEIQAVVDGTAHAAFRSDPMGSGTVERAEMSAPPDTPNPTRQTVQCRQ